MEKPAKPGQQVLVALRRMIADGTIKPGDRIAEIPTAEALGVSRMPVRTALRALEHEGLVVKLGARGYTPRAVDAEAITGAIEVRGVLEGLAARRLAERRLTPAEQAQLEAILAEGDALFAKGHLADGDLDGFYRYNLAFHDLLIAASANPSIALALARNNHLPFASAAALALDWDDLEGEYRHLSAAHREHRAVFDAIVSGDAGQAERLMRAHAGAATANRKAFRMLAG
ncbi:GntR family transcriptional regulator [Sphingomonas sp. HT-1]|jgi:GntR family transcriptional regulator of vanillate catabolism|uniref:GntR family transcriptional regulator n=1 Tax=unclassified Sphingomonas TaxID=196159 RepID=UPI0002D679C6|nr:MULTISPECIES: GntR family transcriptional regulator [unclassified Sphingomonas]KTF69127.1 GntR family transcriptional regulator [Sphingomonas sp. WG]